MSQIENRQYPRFPLRMPVLCEGPVVRDYRSIGLTQNVSRGGLLLEVSSVLPQGAATNLRLLTDDRVARAEGVVVWTAENSRGLMGIRFVQMTAGDFLAWEQLLAFQAGPAPRVSLRIPVDLGVTCLVPPETRLPARVKNLSDGGMMIVLPKEVAPQTRMRVMVPAWLNLSPLEAEVVWNRTNAAVDGVVHGLRFVANDIGQELFLISTLLRRLLR